MIIKNKQLSLDQSIDVGLDGIALEPYVRAHIMGDEPDGMCTILMMGHRDKYIRRSFHMLISDLERAGENCNVLNDHVLNGTVSFSLS